MFVLAVELEKESARKPKGAEHAQRDLDLWHSWSQGGKNPDDLRPLLHQFKGMIRYQANRYAGNIDMPPAVIHAEFNKQFLNALHTFDPDKGKLGTWVGNNLKKAQRYINYYQNPARIVETRTGHQKGLFDNALATLDDQFGREPSNREISEYLGWAEPEVERMQAESRKAIYSGSWAQGIDPTTRMPSRETELIRLIKPELSPEEEIVYNYTVGDGGMPQLRPGEIARKTGFSPSKVSRLRNSITAKLKKYY